MGLIFRVNTIKTGSCQMYYEGSQFIETVWRTLFYALNVFFELGSPGNFKHALNAFEEVFKVFDTFNLTVPCVFYRLTGNCIRDMLAWLARALYADIFVCLSVVREELYKGFRLFAFLVYPDGVRCHDLFDLLQN